MHTTRRRTLLLALGLLAAAPQASGLTIIVPGTWARGFIKLDAHTDWAEPGTPFHTAVSTSFGAEAIVLEWSGSNSKHARAAAAQALKHLIDSHPFAAGEPLNVVTHSHGGNVVKAYTNLRGARRIDRLVSLGAPQRADYRINDGNVRAYDNVYSLRDLVQINGGPFGGMAPRTDPVATNLDVSSIAGGHSDLHTEPVWRDVEQKTTKKD
jgi:hypothetical protein